MTDVVTRSEQSCFGGRQGFYSHHSSSTGSEMRFGVFTPPQALRGERVPALYYLAGLTCTEETFFIKAGAQKLAAELGLMLVACDTSPRGLNLPGDSESWDFGVGAGFYVDATEAPWASHYRMGCYVNEELPALIETHFPASKEKRGIFGHSMGGHGALVTALRNKARWHSVSAFAPIANPCAVAWGKKAFSRYLGSEPANSEPAKWSDWDASRLIENAAHPCEMLIDQGDADQFLTEQLHPEALEKSAGVSGQKLRLRRHAGYDHSYWFIQTFIDDHLRHHVQQLARWIRFV